MNKNVKFILISIIMFIASIVFCSKVNAASASVVPSSESVTVGEKVTITTTINGASWNLNLSGAVQASYVDVTDDGENTTKTYTTSFTASTEGEYKVSISGTVTDGNLEKETISKTITITANKKEETPPPQEETPPAKSNNANLGNLGIRPNDFKGFKSGTTSYNVTVPNDVDKVEVYAVAKDSKATVSGTGSKNLNVGSNALTVTVTAEDGTTKTYTINVTREEKTETTENTTSNETTNETSNEISNEVTNETTNTTSGETIDYSEYDLQELEIEGYALSPKFRPDVYEYKIDIPSKDVTTLNVKTKGKNDKVKIEVVGNTDLKDGENILTILVTNEVTGDNSTYQIIANKTDLSETNNAIDANIAKANKIRKIILGIVIFIVLATIIFIVVRHKMSKNNDDYNENNDDDNDYIDEEMPKALQKNIEKTLEKQEDENIEEVQNQPEEQKQESEYENKTEELEDDDYNRKGRRSGKGKHF